MTSTGLPLFDAVASRLEQEFREFHRENPTVLDRVIDEARTLRRAGLSSCGVDFVLARLRWVDVVETRGGDGFRINNNFGAFYARLAMHVAADLAGFFEVRMQKSAGAFDPATVPVLRRSA